MAYSLIAFFLLTGDSYVEQQGLSLQSCAGQAAMARQAYLAVLPKLNSRIGEVRFLCVAESRR
jgi:hypothetical protein